jgi:hypothetical protein
MRQPTDFRRSNLSLPGTERATLESWVRARTTQQRIVLRSLIVLQLADGRSAREVARRLGVSRHTVDLWRARFLAEGCDSLTHDRPGRGRKPRTASHEGRLYDARLDGTPLYSQAAAS